MDAERVGGDQPVVPGVPPGRVAQIIWVIKDGDTVTFKVTDTAETLSISYRGILPDLFAEGQGVVAMGKLDGKGRFVADQVLAKHDENYMSPEVKAAMDAAKLLQADGSSFSNKGYVE